MVFEKIRSPEVVTSSFDFGPKLVYDSSFSQAIQVDILFSTLVVFLS